MIVNELLRVKIDLKQLAFFSCGLSSQKRSISTSKFNRSERLISRFDKFSIVKVGRAGRGFFRATQRTYSTTRMGGLSKLNYVEFKNKLRTDTIMHQLLSDVVNQDMDAYCILQDVLEDQ